MNKSIFRKLLTTYLLITIAIITALSLIMSALYSRKVFDEKHKSLQSAAVRVNQLAGMLSAGSITKEELETAMDSLGYVTDSKIYLVRLDEKALSMADPAKLKAELEDHFLLEDLKKILQGSTVFRQKQYSDKFGMYVVFAGVPWKTDSGIQGAILLFSPVDSIAEEIANINLVIWLTSLVLMLLSALVIYFSASRLSRPIKYMESAAAKLAAGENTEDLDVKSRDEIGKLADTFNYMKNQLANTERMRRDFIANVSHDLRTPLTSINGFIEAMIDGVVKPEDYGKYLNIIHEETNRLTRLTTDILQLAKIQSGNLKLNRETQNVLPVLNSVIGSLQALAAERPIAVSADCAPEVSVYADNDRLKQILINLIGNSIKYGSEGGMVRISVSETASVTRFSIKDDGMGIPEDELPYIFEKFYRVDKARQSRQSGTGLGLNIVKGLVEMHGGRIRASSEIGSGTEMTFELPKA